MNNAPPKDSLPASIAIEIDYSVLAEKIEFLYHGQHESQESMDCFFLKNRELAFCIASHIITSAQVGSFPREQIYNLIDRKSQSETKFDTRNNREMDYRK